MESHNKRELQPKSVFRIKVHSTKNENQCIVEEKRKEDMEAINVTDKGGNNIELDAAGDNMTNKDLFGKEIKGEVEDIETLDDNELKVEIKEEEDYIDMDQHTQNLASEIFIQEESEKWIECKTESEFLYSEQEEKVLSDSSSDDASVETRCQDNQPRRKRLKHQHNNSATTNKPGLTTSASSEDQETCPICREDLGDISDVDEVRQKGADGINSASVQKGDDIVVSAGEKVHSECRQRYIQQGKKGGVPKGLVASLTPFSSDPPQSSATVKATKFVTTPDGQIFRGTGENSPFVSLIALKKESINAQKDLAEAELELCKVKHEYQMVKLKLLQERYRK